MTIGESRIKVERTARVYTLGKLSSSTRKIWLVAHGYGQLAQYFIANFNELDLSENFIIAPEALSRAYIDGLTGRVGASWMTKEMREDEISDYVTYLDSALESSVPENILQNSALIALGFSQGAATISRWAYRTQHKVDAMVLWGGEPGSELLNVKSYKNVPVYIAIGTEDTYITKERRERLLELCHAKGWSFHILEYQGGHHLDKSLISAISYKV